MKNLFGEPVLVLVGGAAVLVPAVMQVIIALGYPISNELQVAITSLIGVISALLARSQVTPMSTLPPGTAGKIADAAEKEDKK